MLVPKKSEPNRLVILGHEERVIASGSAEQTLDQQVGCRNEVCREVAFPIMPPPAAKVLVVAAGVEDANHIAIERFWTGHILDGMRLAPNALFW